MNALTRACLVALALFALASSTQAQQAPCKFDAGINAHVGANFGGVGIQAGPWYSYFPYNAYFQTPAPVGGWPFWPTASASAGMPAYMGAPAGPAAPAAQSMFYPPRGIQPVGYAPAPSYWYGR